MNGIYIGQFNNGPLVPNGSEPFFNCIYIIGSNGGVTVSYAFTMSQYGDGHLFFNRMTGDNIWQIADWKKLI